MFTRIPENVIGAVYNSNHFHHSKAAKEFVGEISEVSAVLRQLWNDSLDIGFGIRSVKTGNIVFWTLTAITKDAEGDTVSWTFEPYLPDHAIIGYSVEILNY